MRIVWISLMLLFANGSVLAKESQTATSNTPATTKAGQQTNGSGDGKSFVSVREQYKESLKQQLAKVDIAPLLDACEAAKRLYRSSSAELARITEELKIPVNHALGREQREYHSQLKSMQRDEERKVEQAKKDALDAGKTLETTRGRYEAIKAEIARIEDAVESDGDNSPSPGNGYAASSPRHSGISATERVGRTVKATTTYEIPDKSDFLPAEFQRCFPGEISHAPST